jgi:hypothetical protein
MVPRLRFRVEIEKEPDPNRSAVSNGSLVVAVKGTYGHLALVGKRDGAPQW